MKITNQTDIFGRRDFLRIGSLGVGGLSIANALRAAKDAKKKDISCILLWQSGGSPQLDTFDMKPDAPAEIRGEFLAIDTALSRLQQGELCLILIDRVDEALTHIARRCAEV